MNIPDYVAQSTSDDDWLDGVLRLLQAGYNVEVEQDIAEAKAVIQAHETEAVRLAIAKREPTTPYDISAASKLKSIKSYKIYVLELEGGFYYIGVTSQLDVQTRFDEHLRGTGAWWTRLHRPLRVVEVRDLKTDSYHDACVQENLLALEYIDRYGLDTVRGGIITSPMLDEATKWLEFARRRYAGKK